MSTYNLDLRGTSPANLIRDEKVTISVPQNLEDASFFVPRFAPFYERGLVIKDGVGNSARTLVPGSDYILTHEFVTLTYNTGLNVYGSVSLVNRNTSGDLYITYQTVGGQFVQPSNLAVEQLILMREEHNYATWEMIVDVPEQLPAELHPHTAEEVLGVPELNQGLGRIVEALEQMANRPVEDPTDNGDSDNSAFIVALNDHINATAAHTPGQVGLGNVNNWGIANNTQAAQRVDNKYVTPYLVDYIVKYMFNNGFKPAATLRMLHGTLSDNVNIVYVENTLPTSKSTFLFKGIENSETVHDPLTRTNSTNSTASDIYLVFQTFSSSGPSDDLPTTPDRRYLIAFGMNNPKMWVRSMNSGITNGYDSGWIKPLRPMDIGLGKLRNMSYVDHRNFLDLFENPPSDNSASNTDEYVSKAGIQAAIARLYKTIPAPPTFKQLSSLNLNVWQPPGWYYFPTGATGIQGGPETNVLRSAYVYIEDGQPLGPYEDVGGNIASHQIQTFYARGYSYSRPLTPDIINPVDIWTRIIVPSTSDTVEMPSGKYSNVTKSTTTWMKLTTDPLQLIGANGAKWHGLGGYAGSSPNNLVLSTGSRQAGVTYTNVRTYPIQVQIHCDNSSHFVVDNEVIAVDFASDDGLSVDCIIPAGSTYQLIIRRGNLRSWSELY